METFKQFGILIDKEQTDGEEEESQQFILQIFSFPVFDADTFFLEIIQRQNSRGFGGGNIRALAESLIVWEREREKLLVSLADHPTSPAIFKSCSNEDFKCFYPPTETFGMRRSVTV